MIDSFPSNFEKGNKYKLDLDIHEDLSVLFQPDGVYLRLQNELQSIVKPFYDEQFFFWFPEDLAFWEHNNQDFLDRIQECKHYDYFSKPSYYCAQLEELNITMHRKSNLIEANAEFESINKGDKCHFNCFLSKNSWFTNYIFLNSFSFDNIDNGYYTFNGFFPILGFSNFTI